MRRLWVAGSDQIVAAGAPAWHTGRMEDTVPHPYSVEVEPEPTGFRWKIREHGELRERAQRLHSSPEKAWEEAVKTSAHVRQRTSRRTPEEQSHVRSEGKPITRGDTAMTKFFRSADAAEIYALEHRFPFATALISAFLAGNVGSAVLMLLAQA
jgi:hypothetical protein